MCQEYGIKFKTSVQMEENAWLDRTMGDVLHVVRAANGAWKGFAICERRLAACRAVEQRNGTNSRMAQSWRTHCGESTKK